MTNEQELQTTNAVFFDEYTSHAAILKYTRGTAGFGISYLLDNDYKDVYCWALEQLPSAVKSRGLRILEFGCGGGMNLIHLLSLFKQQGIKVGKAVGTDFSPVLIDAAKQESKNYLAADDCGRIEFHVAKNESLIQDIAAATGVERSKPVGSFDLLLGVNTIRYCHRGHCEMDCARDIFDLLTPGGVAVVIDMNDRFPAFRSTIRNLFRERNKEECYLPRLDEYAAPFEKTGFDILRKEHFCWIPHSSGKLLCSMLRTLAPLLSAVAPSRAMRSLVVVRKPL